MMVVVADRLRFAPVALTVLQVVHGCAHGLLVAVGWSLAVRDGTDPLRL